MISVLFFLIYFAEGRYRNNDRKATDLLFELAMISIPVFCQTIVIFRKWNLTGEILSIGSGDIANDLLMI